MLLEFAKGHGTRNDFVVFADPDNLLDLTAAQVSFLCDRRGGVGGDGILRAVRANQVPEWSGERDVWFMDYRNADGSIAEMCGNGVRVFLRYLEEEGLVTGERVSVATRAGLRTGRFLPDGRIAVTMGPATCGGEVRLTVGANSWPATSVNVGNPHAVAELETAAQLAALDLSVPPTWEPADAFPSGVNAEFVVREAPGRIRLRVHERGVGETESCGTGVVAAAAAAGQSDHCTVEVIGGTLEVDLTGPEAVLIGPAVVVARGTCLLPT
ncbi:diaminopimelate epimerase [Propionicimonas sp.]|jgi:diaminopimelate epimerase|uniref:diaminopimelate epimerase n=1 Tax=Propionicimonas sp. TaxID=1955623 RepID=UPI0039C8F168